MCARARVYVCVCVCMCVCVCACAFIYVVHSISFWTILVGWLVGWLSFIAYQSL